MDSIRTTPSAFKPVAKPAPKRPEKEFNGPYFDREGMIIELAMGMMKMAALAFKR